MFDNSHPKRASFSSESEFSGRDAAEDNYRFWPTDGATVSVRKSVTFRPLVTTVKLPFSLIRGPKKMYRINLIKIYFYIN
jgi:hypothetical protein